MISSKEFPTLILLVCGFVGGFLMMCAPFIFTNDILSDGLGQHDKAIMFKRDKQGDFGLSFSDEDDKRRNRKKSRSSGLQKNPFAESP